MRRHKLIAALAAVALVATAGGAYAATQSSNNSRQALLNDVAKRLNVTPAELNAAIQGALLDRLNAAVKAGRIAQAQANQLKQRIEQGRFGGSGLFGGRGRGFGPPPWSHGRGPLGGARTLGLGAAASYLGLSQSQLFNQMFNQHQSLAQIAKAHGKSVSGLEQALASAERSRLDALVKAGRITQAQEQKALSRLSTQIDRLVNRVPRQFTGGPPAPGGPGQASQGGPASAGLGAANLAPPRPPGPPPPAA